MRCARVVHLQGIVPTALRFATVQVVQAVRSPNVRAVLSEHGLSPSRALGQHFLTDPNTARRIVRLADIGAGDRVLEIGPGLGSLTVALADAGARVLALELDRHLLPALHSVVDGLEAVEVVQGDAMTFDVAAALGDEPCVCVSNLPYNVATPVVIRLLEHAPQVDRMLVMVQREVGERLAAPPGTRACGPASVKVAYYGDARMVGAVPRTVFHPQPKVESALVRIDRRAEPAVDVPSPETMFALARAGFGQRRKTLRRALRPLLGPDAAATLEQAGIDSSARAESLDLAQWAELARQVVR